MSYRTRIIYTRPNTDVAWYVPTEEAISYRRETYVDTGKIVSEASTDGIAWPAQRTEWGVAVESADGLTRTVTLTWDSEASFNEFMADSTYNIQLRNPRNLYNDHNGITRTWQHDI